MRPAPATDPTQPPPRLDRGFTGGDDVPVGAVRGAVRGVRDRAGGECAGAGAASVFYGLVSGLLGAVFGLWLVSFYFSFSFPGFVISLIWEGGGGEEGEEWWNHLDREGKKNKGS